MGTNATSNFKIEMDLRNQIVAGDYKPGHLLPSERELVDTYKVSRLTGIDRIFINIT